MSSESPAASIQEGTGDVQQSSTDVDKGEKRSIDEPLDEEDIPVMQRLNKRVRYAEADKGEQVTEPSVPPVVEDASVDMEPTPLDMQVPQRRESESEPSTKRLKKKKTPSCRPTKQSIAKWVTKYKIEACCIRLDPCDRMLEVGQD